MIIAYKGFNKDMTCTPTNDIKYQYEEGKTYKTDSANICHNGFHACEMPLDVFKYYRPSKSIYHEVEQGGEISRKNGDSKVSSTVIKIGARIGIKDLVRAQIEFVVSKIKNNNKAAKNDKDIDSAATSGNWSSAATSGDWSSAATSGNGSSAATSGAESSAATSGAESSAATSGNWSSAATSGDWSSAATSGNGSSAVASGNGSSAATSGYKTSAAASGNGSSAATSGNGSSAVVSGDWSSAATSGNGSSAATSGNGSSAATSNKNAIALACGRKSIAKGVVGSYIVLTEWNDEATEIICAKMAQVDGEIIKADTWYTLKNGEFIEAEND